MFSLTGDLKAYPLVEGLKGSQFDIDNQNAIYSAFQQTFALEPGDVDYTEGEGFNITAPSIDVSERLNVDIKEPTEDESPETLIDNTGVPPEREDLTLKQAQKIDISKDPIFDNWADSGMDKKSHLIERVEITLLNALNGDISDIDPELLEWVQPFLEQFNIDNTITE